jgi:hypothetical protein
MDVIEFSQKTKQEAQSLLKQGNVLTVLSKHGRVVLSGAYKHDLMWGPDIDITVTSNDPEKSSVNALLEFIEQRNFQKYQLGDFIKFSREDRPKGMIVVLIQEYKGRKWEIEIWFQKALSESDSYFDKLLTSASEEQRKIILEIKNQRENSHISKHALRSGTIYKGVLSEKKLRIEDFIHDKTI